MKIHSRFEAYRFFLATAFLAGLAWATHASAQQLHPYLLDLNDGTATRVGAPGEFPLIYDISDAGQVVGTFRTVDGFFHPFITGPNGAGMKDLGMQGGATGVNAAGQVVGQFSAGNIYHGFITGPDGVGMRDLGALSGDFSHATAINAAGQVVGQSSTDYGTSAFITGPDGAGMRDLGVLGGIFSTANDINATGQVVGYATPAGGGPSSHAFITGPDGTGMIDLNSLVELPAGFIVTRAIAINNNNQVIATAVPEPGFLALLLAGLVLIGAVVQRKNREAMTLST